MEFIFCKAKITAALSRFINLTLLTISRTRYCEIDIVSMKDDVLWFTEVKYRKNDDFGGGLGVITAEKQRQMRFAAELFMTQSPQYEGCDMRLLVVAVEGNPPVVKEAMVLN